MNCRQCTRRLSEHVDRTLDARARARVEEHLAGCPSCAAARRELEESIRLLREAASGEAPVGLADGILLKLASVQGPRASAAPAGFRSVRARIAVAAALVLASLAGVLAWQGRSLAGRVAGLEATVTDMGGRWQIERQGFVDALERAREDLRMAREAAERAEASRAEELALRKKLEDAVTRMDEALRKETGRAVRGAEELAVARNRALLLETEVAMLREETARRAEEEGALLTAGRLERDAIVLRQRSGRIELETRGPPQVFIPRLFELARDDSDPEISSLALSSLEGILGARGPVAKGSAEQELPDARVGPAKWLQRGVGVFTSAASVQGDAADDGASEETPRERRLRALESVWRTAAGA